MQQTRITRPDLSLRAGDPGRERRTLPAPQQNGGRGIFAGWGPKI